MAFKNGMRPAHPGEVLREEYLRPLDMSVNALAKRLGIPTSPEFESAPLEQPDLIEPLRCFTHYQMT